MPHQRQVIRHAIRDVLLDATAAEDRVFPSRVIPLRKLELPAINVYTLEDEVDRESANTAPRELSRDLSVVIQGWVNPGESVDDAVDALCLEIETAMHADPHLDGECSDLVLESTDLDIIEEGDRLMGLASLTYAVRYYTFAPEPPADSALDDFETVQATHNLGGTTHVDDEAVDHFTVQESEPS